MDCEKIKAQLSVYIDGELPEKDAAVIKEHLSLCADCAREEQLLRKTSQLLKAWENVTAPDGFCEALLARAESTPRRSRRITFQALKKLEQKESEKSFLSRAVRPIAGPRALVRVAIYGAVALLVCVGVIFFATSPLKRAPMVEPPPSHTESIAQKATDTNDTFESAFRYTTMAEMKVAGIWK